MHILAAGATGALGRRLVPLLVSNAHAKANRELGWRAAHPSWRAGSRGGLGSAGAVRRPEPRSGLLHGVRLAQRAEIR
jgi:hypothetical protein